MFMSSVLMNIWIDKSEIINLGMEKNIFKLQNNRVHQPVRKKNLLLIGLVSVYIFV